MRKQQTEWSRRLPIIGWREYIAFPQLKIDQIKAKIDTGARSSALHAYQIQRYQHHGETMIHFQINPYQGHRQQTMAADAKLLEMRSVRNSGGIAERRPVIETQVTLAHQTWSIELTLTNRDVMGFRMLLGRQAVRNQFLIDPGKSFLQSTSQDSQ